MHGMAMEFRALTNMAIEVAVFAVLIYLVLRFLRETRGSGVVRGLAFLLIVGLAVFGLLIKTMELDRLALLFQTVAQSVVIALVIVFHPEIRRAIVHLGDSPIFGRIFQKESKIVQRVLRAVARMSKERIGALIAVERDASLQSLAESGITIDAELNSFLIESIFYPKSALHDGAIVVRDDRIVAASCLLPLSQNPEVDKRLGTRHRAALGLSEETDALAIVVSEETGKVSVAQGGKLSFDLTLEKLEDHMDEALGARQRSARRAVRPAVTSLWTRLSADPVRKLLAIALGVGLWFLLDSQITSVYAPALQLGTIASGETMPHDDGVNQLFVMLPPDRIKRGFLDLNANPIDRVTISFRGPKSTIESLRTEGLKLGVALPNIAWDKVESADFTVDDVQRTHRVFNDGSVTMTMDPPRVRILVVGISSETVQVSADKIELSYGADDRLKARVREETFDFVPKFAHVVGPEQALQAFLAKKNEKLLRAQMVARQGERQLVAAVSLQPDFEQLGLRLKEPVSLSVQLRPVMETFTLNLPVLVVDHTLPRDLRGQYQPETPTIETKVRAGGALLSRLKTFEDGPRAQWAKTNMFLMVWIQPREDDSPYPTEFRQLARLHVLSPNENAGDYDLDEPVSVLLRRP
jgi:diadenylate cyclase